MGDRFCVHKARALPSARAGHGLSRFCQAEFDRPIGYPGDGAGGSGVTNRLFQYAGNCARQSDAVRDHGCKRRSTFLSPQALVSCGTLTENSTLYPQDAGCNGGNAYEAWRFFRLTGSPPMDLAQTTGCVPYTAGTCTTPGGDPNNDGCKKCAGLLDQCQDTGLPPPLYKVDTYGIINTPELPPRNNPAVDRPESEEMRQRELNVMHEIHANGPVLACIFDYANFVDFYNKYPLGVYNSTEGSEAFGGHCMNIIGWGVDASSGMKYWLVKNSWGPAWGSAGIVRFKRGVDYLGIESDVWAACPAGAAHCTLTDGVDTSVMEMPWEAARARLLAGGAMRGGGYWSVQRPDSLLVLRAAADYLAAQQGEELPAGAKPEEVLAAHGVTVASAHSQVVSGFRLRMQLNVPSARVAPLTEGVTQRNAVTLLAQPGTQALTQRGAAAALLDAVLRPSAALTDVVNHGCETGAACAGRSSVHNNGQTFCCPAGCGRSCSISASTSNGNTVAACSCSARIQVDMLHRAEGGMTQFGAALAL